jgi:hypothetical protein
VALFSKRPTPSDCIERISNAMDEVVAIRGMLDAASKGKDYKADWDANRKYAHEHLAEAWSSLGAALNGLCLSKREPTRDEQVDATVELQKRHLIALRAEVKRLEGALTLAEARAAAAEVAVQHAQPHPEENQDLSHKLRRVVMSAIHPDKAADAAEGEWRTKLCQTLFPEIDRVVNGT